MLATHPRQRDGVREEAMGEELHSPLGIRISWEEGKATDSTWSATKLIRLGSWNWWTGGILPE